jgi:hypothetical protein
MLKCDVCKRTNALNDDDNIIIIIIIKQSSTQHNRDVNQVTYSENEFANFELSRSGMHLTHKRKPTNKSNVCRQNS